MRLQAHQLKAMTAHKAAGLPAETFVMPAPVAKKPRSREESIMQVALVRWWQINCRHFNVPELALMSIPNGGGRSGPVVGSILKAEGLRKGAPDLFLAASRPKKPTVDGWIKSLAGDPDAPFFGLFLELKRPQGTVSPEQEVYHEILVKQGYRVEVIRTLQQGIDVITSYLT